MKNTLLVVLIIAFCYDHIQAQIQTTHSPGYIKYQGTYSNQSVEAGRVIINPITDGIAATDKLASSILTGYKMADGVATTDKLADDIINSLGAFKEIITVEAQAFSITPVDLLQHGQHAHISDMKYQLYKPRPIKTKKTGRL